MNHRGEVEEGAYVACRKYIAVVISSGCLLACFIGNGWVVGYRFPVFQVTANCFVLGQTQREGQTKVLMTVLLHHLHNNGVSLFHKSYGCCLNGHLQKGIELTDRITIINGLLTDRGGVSARMQNCSKSEWWFVGSVRGLDWERGREGEWWWSVGATGNFPFVFIGLVCGCIFLQRNLPYLSLAYLGVQYTAQYNETVVQVHSHLHFSKEEMEIQPSEWWTDEEWGSMIWMGVSEMERDFIAANCWQFISNI